MLWKVDRFGSLIFTELFDSSRKEIIPTKNSLSTPKLSRTVRGTHDAPKSCGAPADRRPWE